MTATTDGNESNGLTQRPVLTKTQLKEQKEERKKLKSLKPLRKSALSPAPKKRKYTRLENKTAQQLVKPTDDAFSKYIRIRDSQYMGNGRYVGTCITCSRQMEVLAEEKWRLGAQNGHFITRGVFLLRWDEDNCHLQCGHCNAWRDKEDMLEAYRHALELKCGKYVVRDLKRRSKLPDAYKRPPKAKLLEMIEYYNNCVKVMREVRENG